MREHEIVMSASRGGRWSLRVRVLLLSLVLPSLVAVGAVWSPVAAAVPDGTVWDQLGVDIDGEGSSDQSGYSVAASADGNTVVIGARNNDGNGDDSGHARVHDWNGSTWTQRGSDIDGEAAGDQSGAAVAMSADGNTVII
jgi:hypothetical protein